MATPAVPTTNVGIYNHLRPATDCNQTTNLSLASLCNGGNFGGIDHTFGGQGGPAQFFDVIGGTNNPITTTPNSLNLFDDIIGTAPFNLANTIGGKYT
jgi:hypothetical protein